MNWIRRRPVWLVLTAIIFGTGCVQSGQQMRLQSPVDLLHSAAFGQSGLSGSGYKGSEHARDWDRAEQLSRMQQQVAAPAPGSSLQ